MTINDLGKLACMYNPVVRTDFMLATKRHAPLSVSTVSTPITYAIDPSFISQINEANMRSYQDMLRQNQQITYSTATGTGGPWPANFATWMNNYTK